MAFLKKVAHTNCWDHPGLVVSRYLGGLQKIDSQLDGKVGGEEEKRKEEKKIKVKNPSIIW